MKIRSTSIIYRLLAVTLLAALLLAPAAQAQEPAVVDAALAPDAPDTIPVNSNFESGSWATEGWTTVAGTTNQWRLNTAAGSSSGGLYAAFVGNAVNTFSYSNTASNAVSHFYKDVTFAAGETIIVLNFEWRGLGNNSDYLKVYLAPTSVTPAANTEVLATYQVGASGGYYTGANNGTDWQPVSILIPSSWAGSTGRLIFSWRNNTSTTNNPPIAVDNIKIVTSAAPATGTTPVQTYYMTMPEASALSVFQTIVPTSCGLTNPISPITTYASIAIAADGTVIYYDQQEDGYDADIANPGANVYANPGNLDGTQIWGDGVTANGAAPGVTGDYLTAGTVIILNNNVPLPRGTTVLYDGGDKVAANKGISLARAYWAGGSGTLFSFAHEMYPTSEWGTEYDAPVGANTNSYRGSVAAADFAGDMFEYAALSIMASESNTTVWIDTNADGTVDTTQTLGQGGAYLAAGVSEGAKVTANKPVQVVLLTGDVCEGYESRDMTLLPVSSYGSSYWASTGMARFYQGWGGYTGPARLFLYNPSTTNTINVRCQRRTTSPTILTQSVGPRATVIWNLSADYEAAHCWAVDGSDNPTADKFFGVGVADAQFNTTNTEEDASTADWSITLYPEDFLSTDALIGLGLGRDPTSGTSQTQNGSPLWVTPACSDTYIYVDWNNDGAPDRVDLDSNGNTTGTVDGISESSSNAGIHVTTALKSLRLYEPILDIEYYDQTAARVWSRDASGNPGCKLVVAWGQNTAVASYGAPGLDMGISIPPLRLVEGTKELLTTWVTDIAPTGQYNPGDVVTYQITIKNAGATTVNNVRVYDAVPANTTYVANTTQTNTTGAWTDIGQPDGGVLPLAVNNPDPTPDGYLLGDMATGATWYVRFNVRLGTAGVYDTFSNCDTTYTDAGRTIGCVSKPVVQLDWGDLPDTYGTTLAADGPRHTNTGLFLGTAYDYNGEGAPTADATGDDGAADDEDGITAQPNWNTTTKKLRFPVTVSGATGTVYLAIWIDWDKSGAFNTAAFASGGEMYLVPVVNGSNAIELDYPSGFTQDTALEFRLRLYPTNPGTPLPTGYVAGGEVEDYIYGLSPLAVDLASFTAAASTDGVTLAWETVSETANAGFNVYRAESDAGPWARLNAALIPAAAPGSSEGHAYTWTDATAAAGVPYWYMLEDVALDGATTQHAPVAVTTDPGEPNALGLAAFGATSMPALAGLAALAALALAAARRRHGV